MKAFSFSVLVFLFFCGLLFNCFHVVPFLKDEQKQAIEEAGFSVDFAKSFINEYGEYDKPVVWRLMTSKEKKDYRHKNSYSFSSSAICLTNNFGRAITNPLTDDPYGFQCDEEHLKKWIIEENRKEKEAFAQTGHCRDYLYWQKRLKQLEQNAKLEQENILHKTNGKIFISFLILIFVFASLWWILGFIFRCLDKRKKRGVRKEQGKKYLDLSNEDK